MKVSLQLDLIEQEITDPERQASLPNRRILLKWLSRELNRFASFEEWDFFAHGHNLRSPHCAQARP
jgi:hypothetical protein